jgi:hypothetical protein
MKTASHDTSPTNALGDIDRMFGSSPRPDQFTNDPTHCPECAEHEETLRSCTRETIGLEKLGQPGWDPICMASEAAFRYYLPALARLAFGRGEQQYLPQFVSHVGSRRASAFNPAERRVLARFLEALRASMADELSPVDVKLLDRRLRGLTRGEAP